MILDIFICGFCIYFLFVGYKKTKFGDESAICQLLIQISILARTKSKPRAKINFLIYWSYEKSKNTKRSKINELLNEILILTRIFSNLHAKINCCDSWDLSNKLDKTYDEILFSFGNKLNQKYIPIW